MNIDIYFKGRIDEGDRMNDYRSMLNELKCAIFDLLSSSFDELQLETTLVEFKKLFMNCFEIPNSDILLYDNNRFIPLSLGEESASISNDSMKDHPILNVSFISNVAHVGSEYADDSLVIRDYELNPLGAVLFKSTDKWLEFASTSYLKELKKVFGTFFSQVVKIRQLYDKEKTYRRLFEVTELFNSTMESNVILEGMMGAVSKSFPAYEVHLLLSHEQKGKIKEYRLFDYLNERASAVDAFLSGEMTVEKALDLSCNLMNAPIRGRQGIYGVLQIMAPKDTEFTVTQKNFIRLISNAAGSALENASLYEQSHRLVNDLQLVNEASRKLNSNLDLQEMIAFLMTQFKKAFQPSEMAFVFNEDYDIAPISTSFFQDDAGAEFVDKIFARFSMGEEAIFDANVKNCEGGGNSFKSLVALPITNRGDMIGFVVLLHKEEYFFSFDSFKLMRSLISHSSLAISNILLRDQLQELVDKDNLTKLYTRTYLDKSVAAAINKKEESIFLLLDVDDFKMVNDSYGHTTGDEVLRQISSFILSKIKGFGIASRWGGEEIAIFLPSMKMEDGIEFAKMLVESIPAQTNPQVTVSIGMSRWSPTDGTSYKEIFQFTDKALYRAKNNGKNQYIIHGVSSSK